MKRTLAFILALFMCISLCACDSNEEPEEKQADDEHSKAESQAELIESTPTLDVWKMWEEVRTNYAKAKLDYDGQMFKVSLGVTSISDDHFEGMVKIYDDDGRGWGLYTISVELPIEDLATLSEETYVTVLGKLSFVYDHKAVLEDAFIVDSGNDE